MTHGTHRNVTEDGQQNVDEEISIAAALEEDTQRREEDGEDELADVGSGEGHFVVGCWLLAVVWWIESGCSGAWGTSSGVEVK